MVKTRAFGRGLGDHFQLGDAPALISRALRKTELAVTQLKRDEPNLGMTTPIPTEDAYLVALQVREVPDHELWMDDRWISSDPFPACTTTIYDLRRNPLACVRSPFHSLHFYLPLRALNVIAEERGSMAIDDLSYRPGTGIDDPVVKHLGLALLPAFDNPDQASLLFVDYVTMALCVHVADHYGGEVLRVVRGGLTPRQERRAKEMLYANLDGEVCLSDLARECGLSVSHFIRAFRKSTGLPPHRWMMYQRVEKAKALLQSSRSSLLDIASACGFVDQSHFTRVFTRLVGASPGVWRRLRRK
jgi:AraC-like DNA-binding protein